MNLLAMLAVVTLSWTPATQHTDGSPLTIVATRIDYGSCGGTVTAPTFGTKAGEWTQTGTAATSQSPNLNPGTYCFRAFTRGTVNTACPTPCESVASNVARKVVPPTAPQPPANLTVQEDATAFVIIKSRDRVALVPVGTVAPGTACDPSQPVLDKFVVPRASVTFVSTVVDEVVVAACG